MEIDQKKELYLLYQKYSNQLSSELNLKKNHEYLQILWIYDENRVKEFREFRNCGSISCDSILYLHASLQDSKEIILKFRILEEMIPESYFTNPILNLLLRLFFFFENKNTPFLESLFLESMNIAILNYTLVTKSTDINSKTILYGILDSVRFQVFFEKFFKFADPKHQIPNIISEFLIFILHFIYEKPFDFKEIDLLIQLQNDTKKNLFPELIPDKNSMKKNKYQEIMKIFYQNNHIFPFFRIIWQKIKLKDYFCFYRFSNFFESRKKEDFIQQFMNSNPFISHMNIVENNIFFHILFEEKSYTLLKTFLDELEQLGYIENFEIYENMVENDYFNYDLNMNFSMFSNQKDTKHYEYSLELKSDKNFDIDSKCLLLIPFLRYTNFSISNFNDKEDFFSKLIAEVNQWKEKNLKILQNFKYQKKKDIFFIQIKRDIQEWKITKCDILKLKYEEKCNENSEYLEYIDLLQILDQLGYNNIDPLMEKGFDQIYQNEILPLKEFCQQKTRRTELIENFLKLYSLKIVCPNYITNIIPMLSPRKDFTLIELITKEDLSQEFKLSIFYLKQLQMVNNNREKFFVHHFFVENRVWTYTLKIIYISCKIEQIHFLHIVDFEEIDLSALLKLYDFQIQKWNINKFNFKGYMKELREKRSFFLKTDGIIRNNNEKGKIIFQSNGRSKENNNIDQILDERNYLKEIMEFNKKEPHFLIEFLSQLIKNGNFNISENNFNDLSLQNLKKKLLDIWTNRKNYLNTNPKTLQSYKILCLIQSSNIIINPEYISHHTLLKDLLLLGLRSIHFFGGMKDSILILEYILPIEKIISNTSDFNQIITNLKKNIELNIEILRVDDEIQFINPNIMYSLDWHFEHYMQYNNITDDNLPNNCILINNFDFQKYIILDDYDQNFWINIGYPVQLMIFINDIKPEYLKEIMKLIQQLPIGRIIIGKSNPSNYFIISYIHLATDIQYFKRSLLKPLKKFNVDTIISPIMKFNEIYKNQEIEVLLSISNNAYPLYKDKLINIPLNYSKNSVYTISEQFLIRDFIFDNINREEIISNPGIVFKKISQSKINNCLNNVQLSKIASEIIKQKIVKLDEKE